MQLIESVAIFAFLVLLGAAIYMLVCFYICDSQSCKAFNEAEKKSEKGTKEYTLALLDELYNDGIWPIPYIGASILTPLCIWITRIPLTTVDFAIVFLISFMTIYLIFSFFGHHYIKFIASYVSEYIDSSCPGEDTRASDLEPIITYVEE